MVNGEVLQNYAYRTSQQQHCLNIAIRHYAPKHLHLQMSRGRKSMSGAAGLAARAPADFFMIRQNVEPALCEETTPGREALRAPFGDRRPLPAVAPARPVDLSPARSPV